jgi:hypothetical protein
MRAQENDRPMLVRRLHVDLMRIFAAACRPTEH